MVGAVLVGSEADPERLMGVGENEPGLVDVQEVELWSGVDVGFVPRVFVGGARGAGSAVVGITYTVG